MLNEHLDVVGKTTWDLLQGVAQQHSTALNTSLTAFNASFNAALKAALDTRQDQLVALLEKHVEVVKAQASTMDEKVDRAVENHNKIYSDLDHILNDTKNNIATAFVMQDKKADQMEAQIKELQKTVQELQKLLEQKTQDSSAYEQFIVRSMSTFNTGQANFPPPAHRPQPSLAGYYGNAAESGRDGQPPSSHAYDNRSVSSPSGNHNDIRGPYSSGYGQQWTSRPGYPNRNSRDGYPGTQHYGYTGSGSFENEYANGNFPPGFSPSSAGLHYGFDQGTTR